MAYSFISALSVCFSRSNGTFVLNSDLESVFIDRLITQVFRLIVADKNLGFSGISSESLLQIYGQLLRYVSSLECVDPKSEENALAEAT